MNLNFLNVVSAALTLNLKRILCRPANIAALSAVVFAAFFAAAFVSAETPPVQIKIGVLFDASDDASALVAERLMDSRDVGVTAFAPGDEDEMERLIVRGALECGYILPPDLTGRLRDGERNGVVTVVKNDGALADALVNEMLFAALIEAESPYITARSIERVMGIEYGAAIGAAKEGVDYSAAHSAFVEPEYIVRGGGAHMAAPRPAANTPKGVVALLLTLFVLLMLPPFIDEKRALTLLTLNIKALFAYRLSLFLAMALTVFLAGAPALLVAAGAGSASGAAFIGGLPELALYCCALSMSGAAAVSALRGSGVIYGGLIFFMLLNVIFGGVIVDISEIGPVFAAAGACFPSGYYMDGNTAALAAWLAAASAAACILTAAAYFSPRRVSR